MGALVSPETDPGVIHQYSGCVTSGRNDTYQNNKVNTCVGIDN